MRASQQNTLAWPHSLRLSFTASTLRPRQKVMPLEFHFISPSNRLFSSDTCLEKASNLWFCLCYLVNADSSLRLEFIVTSSPSPLHSLEWIQQYCYTPFPLRFPICWCGFHICSLFTSVTSIHTAVCFTSHSIPPFHPNHLFHISKTNIFPFGRYVTFCGPPW